MLERQFDLEPQSVDSNDLKRRQIQIRAHQQNGAATTGRAQIEDLLNDQAAAWNRGDISAFMDHYWRSDELTFSSSGRTLRGWQATLDRYTRRYPDRSAMGELAFSNLEIDIIARDVALVLGNWQLTREAGDIGGNFSLVVQRISGRWLIRHDHTSMLPATPAD